MLPSRFRPRPAIGPATAISPSAPRRHDAARAAAAAIAGFAACAIAATSAADVVRHLYVPPIGYEPARFDYAITHMPDLDQRRSGLGLLGNWHCVPTSAVNMFAYAARHGYPFVYPGPLDFQSDAHHGLLTSAIGQMGDLMSTRALPAPFSEGNGTHEPGGSQGLAFWNQIYAAGSFTFQKRYLSRGDSISLELMAKAGVLGGIVTFGFGRYTVVSSGTGVPDGDLVTSRNGGHQLVLTGAFDGGMGRPLIRFRDPASDEGGGPDRYVSQSEFATTEKETWSRDFPNLGYVDAPTFWPPDFVAGSALVKFRIIDNMTVMRPAAGIGWSTLTHGEVQIDLVSNPIFGGKPSVRTFGRDVVRILDLQFDADALDAIALVATRDGGKAAELRRIDFAGETDARIPSGTGWAAFAIGRHRQIYGHDGGSVYCLRADGEVEAVRSDVQAPEALAYDDARDELLVVSSSTRRITRLGRTLAPRGAFPVPPGLPLGEKPSACIGTDDGALYVASEASGTILRVAFPKVGSDPAYTTLSVPGASRISRLRAGDGGRLYASSEGRLWVLRRNGAGTWSVDKASPFHGRSMSNEFDMMRSRTNFDPELHEGFDWDNVDADDLPDEGAGIPDCVADLDGDGETSSADLAQLLSGWGSDDWRIDLDHDGSVGSADLAILLSSWGACP